MSTVSFRVHGERSEYPGWAMAQKVGFIWEKDEAPKFEVGVEVVAS
jgi:hypothetical protein